jgi:integrase
MERAFGRAVARAGLPAHFTPHALRHTYASLLLSEGADMQYVRQQMGHASIKLTVDLYGSGIRASRPDLLALLDDEPTRHPPQPARHHGLGKVLAFTKPHRRRA